MSKDKSFKKPTRPEEPEGTDLMIKHLQYCFPMQRSYEPNQLPGHEGLVSQVMIHSGQQAVLLYLESLNQKQKK